MMTDSLKPYPAYQDSGVPWLGEIPAHWDLRRLKSICRFAYGDSLPSEIRQNGDVAVYGSNGSVGSHNAANTRAPCIVIGRKGSFGKVNFTNEPVFAIDTTFFVDERFTESNLRWLFYLLGWLELDKVSKDSAVPGLHREEAYQRLTMYPTSLSEQAAIARFLDHVDRRIRRYIRAQRKLIALLEEQKQAIIHRAVTHGLDPDVRLKPSGVEWLGEIPEHWEICPLKYISHRFQNGATPPTEERSYYENGTVPWYGPSSICGEVKIGRPVRLINPKAFSDGRARKVAAPALMVVVIGSTGRSALLESDGSCNQQLTAFELRVDRVEPRFVAHQFQQAEPSLRAMASSATIPILDSSMLARSPVALPPVDEQRRILDHLDRVLVPISSSTNSTQLQIDLLREYRTRLIADVVTGKLDVRQAAADLPEEAEEPEEPDELEEMDEDGAAVDDGPEEDA
jgi:type I restriction enzyme S subunit